MKDRTGKEFRFHPKSGYIIYEDGVVVSPISGIELKQTLNPRGYFGVGNYVGHTSGVVHRAVYEAFIGEILPTYQINHLDGNKINNHISNLEMCTASENTRHAYATGLAKGLRGEDSYISKMSKENVLELYDLFRGGCSNEEVAGIYGHHSRYISLIRHGRRWEYLAPNEQLPESFDRGHSREKLLEVVLLLDLDLTNKLISEWTGVERSQVSRMRNRKCSEHFFYWYDNYFLRGYYVPTGQTKLYKFNMCEVA